MDFNSIVGIAKIVQAVVSITLLTGIVVAYISWKSKQNLEKRNLSLSYSLTKNKQYFDARGQISNRFKTKLESRTPLSEEEITELKENNDRIIDEIKFVLSHWEIMAISIFDDIIDEKTCFEMVGSTLVETVRLLENYIEDVRKEKHNIRRYDYLMILYREWQKRIGKTKVVSRYEQYIGVKEDRRKFERKLASIFSKW